MAEASNQQMQSYADQRVRVRAEDLRDVFAKLADDKAAIDDIYARAAGSSRWNDARQDGPPHLLQSGNSANPDDMLNYNALISTLLDLKAGTATSQQVAAFPGLWATFQRACVRPV